MMHLPAPVSPTAAAAIPISPPPAHDAQSHSSSSSSSFVSWCESQHGSLPTTHQRLLDTAKQGKGTDAAVVPIPTTSAPPATKVGLQTSVDILHQFYGTGKKYGRGARVRSPPKAAAQVVTDDEGDNNNGDDDDSDSDSASYDNEDDDELDEAEDDGNGSYSSSDESVPEVVEIPATAGREEEDLSSIFDLSVDDMMMSEEEYEAEEGDEGGKFAEEEGRDEESIADYGPGPKAVLRNNPATREVGIADNGPNTAVIKDIEAGTSANANEEPPTKKVTRFGLPSPIPKNNKKGVSFSGVGGADDNRKTKNRSELREPKSGRSNKESTKNGENGKKKKKRRSRYISSASSTKAVIQSFMSHTRASMAKTRRSLSKGNKSSTNKASSSTNLGSKPSAMRAKAQRDDNSTAATDATDANVTDAVARAKQRIRQHRQKVRNQGAF